jgi:hypothetical protein
VDGEENWAKIWKGHEDKLAHWVVQWQNEEKRKGLKEEERQLRRQEMTREDNDYVLQLSDDQYETLMRLNDILLPLKINYADFEPKNKELLSLFNLSFAFKYDSIRSFIKKQRAHVFKLHTEARNEFLAERTKWKKKYFAKAKQINDKLDKKHKMQKEILDSMAPAKILQVLEMEDHNGEPHKSTMSGQYCFINPNRYEDNRCDMPPYN